MQRTEAEMQRYSSSYQPPDPKSNPSNLGTLNEAKIVFKTRNFRLNLHSELQLLLIF